MISSYVAVVGTLAALQAVSAQRTEAGQVLQRLENKLQIGDECHSPLGSYVLSKPGQPTMPPCVAEQAIASACEALTNAMVPQSDPAQAAANYKAYQQCLTGPGSSYRQDVMGCLACKEQHNKLSRAQYDYWVSKYSRALDVFAGDLRPKIHFWNYVQATIDWGHYDRLVKPSPGVKVPAKPLAEYYPQPPKVQGLGTFTYNNRTYPEAALRDQGLLLEESVERLDPVGVLVDAQVKAAAPSNTQSQPPAQHTTLVRVVFSSKLPAGNGSVHASSTPLAVSSSKVPVGTGSVRANPTPLAVSSSKLAGTGSVRANSTLLAASRFGAPTSTGAIPTAAFSNGTSTVSQAGSVGAAIAGDVAAAPASHPEVAGPDTSRAHPAVAVADIDADSDTETVVAAAAAAAATSSSQVLVQSSYQDLTVFVRFEGGLSFSLAAVSSPLHVVAGAEVRLISARDAARHQLPDISSCEACKETISLGNPARTDAVANHPAGIVGQEICAVLGDKSLPVQVRQGMAQEILDVVAKMTVGASAHTSAHVHAGATLKSTPLRPAEKQVASGSFEARVQAEVQAQAQVEAQIEAQAQLKAKTEASAEESTAAFC